MVAALGRHDAILRGAIEGARRASGEDDRRRIPRGLRGRERCDRRGDRGAVRVADVEPWGTQGPLRVRMGVHTGSSAQQARGTTYGPAVNRAARLMALANGGQVLVSRCPPSSSSVTCCPKASNSPISASNALKDLARPETASSRSSTPNSPSSSGRSARTDAYSGNLPSQLTSFVGRGTRPRASHADARGAAVDHVDRHRRSRQDAARRWRPLPPSPARYPGASWFCELAGVTDPDGVPGEAIGALFDVKPRPDQTLTRGGRRRSPTRGASADPRQLRTPPRRHRTVGHADRTGMSRRASPRYEPRGARARRRTDPDRCVARHARRRRRPRHDPDAAWQFASSSNGPKASRPTSLSHRRTRTRSLSSAAASTVSHWRSSSPQPE